MKKTAILFLLATMATCMAVILPHPRKVEYGPTVQVRQEKLLLTAPDTPAGNLAREFLELPGECANPELVISLECKDSESDSEAYDVDYGPGKMTITGEGPHGMFNGAMTLLQLIVSREKGWYKVTMARIHDEPAWKERYTCDYNPPSDGYMKMACTFKYGGVAFQHRNNWYNFTPENFAETLAPMRRFKDAGVLRFLFCYNIYAATEGVARERPIFNIAHDDEIDELAQCCKFAYESGFESIMICADDWTPMESGRYVLPSKEEREKFPSTGAGHAYLMNELKERLPQVKWSFCPPVYSLHHTNGNEPGKQYLRDLGAALDTDIQIVWTGSHVIARRTTAADEQEFAGYCGGKHKLLYWDNSECDPAPIHHWDTWLAPELRKETMFINAHPYFFHWMTWFGITANEYLWNPDDYEPKQAYAEIYARECPHYDIEEVFQFQRLCDILKPMTQKDDFQKPLADLKEVAASLDAKGLIHPWTRGALNAIVTRLESELPSMDVPLASTPPVLDGVLDDDCWRQPEQLMRKRYGDALTEGRRTWLRVAFDREAVYVAFRVEYDTLLAPVKPLTHPMDVFGNSDIVEMFLQPQENGPYLQLCADYTGQKATFGDIPDDADYAWSVKTAVGENEWTAEFMIPFKTMVKYNVTPPSNGVSWRANFCREYNAANELQCWSPTHENMFLDADLFGTIIFKE